MKYADSGVNIDAAQRALARSKEAVQATWDERVKSELGSFGGLYEPAPGAPLLVASVDGVGTKVKIATLAGRYDSVGRDLVNHCVDDILVQGAEPLFFLDYFATSHLREDVLPEVLGGFAAACCENGCALLAGETAEMPGVYLEGEFDLAGTIVGSVARENLIDGSQISAGDRIWGLPSSGLHTNGYTLARSIFLERGGYTVDDKPAGLDQTVGEALLAVHRSYLADVRSIWEHCGRTALHGLAHITGGGFYDNVPRVVPDGLTAVVDTNTWTVPSVFRLMAELGQVDPQEMYRVFNMGIGMVAFLPPEIDLADFPALQAIPIGEVRGGDQTRIEVVLPRP